MKTLLLLMTVPLIAQTNFEISQGVKQGELIKIETSATGNLSAKMGKTTVPLFPDEKGRMTGMLPISVTAAVGTFDLTISQDGAALHTAKVKVINGQYPIQNISASSNMKSLTPLPGEMEAMKAHYSAVTPVKLWQGTFNFRFQNAAIRHSGCCDITTENRVEIFIEVWICARRWELQSTHRQRAL